LRIYPHAHRRKYYRKFSETQKKSMTNYLKKRPMKPTGRHEEDVLSGTGGVGVADTTHADVVSKAKDDVTGGEATLAVVCSVVTLALLVLHPN
jgi:hypothetical protein